MFNINYIPILPTPTIHSCRQLYSIAQYSIIWKMNNNNNNVLFQQHNSYTNHVAATPAFNQHTPSKHVNFNEVSLGDLTIGKLNNTLESQPLLTSPYILHTPNNKQYSNNNISIEPTVRKFDHSANQFHSTGTASFHPHPPATSLNLPSNNISTHSSNINNTIHSTPYNTQSINDITSHTHSNLTNLNELYRDRFSLLYEKLHSDYLHKQQCVESIKSYYYNDMKQLIQNIESEYKSKLTNEIELYQQLIQQQKHVDITNIQQQSRTLFNHQLHEYKTKLRHQTQSELQLLKSTLLDERQHTLNELKQQLLAEHTTKCNRLQHKLTKQTDQQLHELQHSLQLQYDNEYFVWQQKLKLQQSDTIAQYKQSLNTEFNNKLNHERDRYTNENKLLLEQQKTLYHEQYNNMLSTIQSDMKQQLIQQSQQINQANIDDMTDTHSKLYQLHNHRMSGNRDRDRNRYGSTESDTGLS